MTVPRTQWVRCPGCGGILARVKFDKTRWSARLATLAEAVLIRDPEPGVAGSGVRVVECRRKACKRLYAVRDGAVWDASKHAEECGQRILQLDVDPVPEKQRALVRRYIASSAASR